MPEESLKYKTKKGLYWSAASSFASRGMQFIFGIILARLFSYTYMVSLRISDDK